MTEFVQNVINAASLGSIYALLAIGIALIFGIMGLLNFAHGELLAITGYTLFVIGAAVWPLLWLAALTVTVVAALSMERVAFRPVRNADPSTLLVTSFGVSYVLQNVGLLAFGARAKGITVPPSILDHSVTVGSITVPVLDVVTTAAAALLVIGLAVFLRFTSIGIYMRAAAEDFNTARVLGVRANTIIAFAFGLSGLLAGVAAMLYVAQTGTLTPSMGLAPVIIAFVATILGGMGSLGGAVLGAYLLGGLTVLLQVVLPIEVRPYRDALLFAAVVLILVFRPRGLIVTRHAQARV
jgi:branched-chain amino acid transport system permease protein